MQRVDAMKADISNADVDTEVKGLLECFSAYLDDAVHDYLSDAVKVADRRSARLHGEDEYNGPQEHSTLNRTGTGCKRRMVG